MAVILSKITVGKFYIYALSESPLNGGGTPAPRGSIAMVDNGTQWIKQGPSDTDWVEDTNTGVPSNPKVYVFCWMSASQVVTANTTKLNFDSKKFDNLSCVQVGTNWRFIAPYTSFFEINMFTDSSTAHYIMIYKNGVLEMSLGYSPVGGANTHYGQIYLEKDQYIEFRSTANATMLGGALTGTSISKVFINSF